MNVRLYHNRRFFLAQKILSILLVFVFVFGDLGMVLNFTTISKVEAAETAIDSTVETDGRSHIVSGSQTVFVDDQTGYKFYRDSDGSCVYSKTTDAGDNWGSAVTIDSQTDCIKVRAWYDKWTPGDTGSYIHIVTMDTSGDLLYYNRIDTASADARLNGSSPVDASSNSGNNTSTYNWGANNPTITKGTDGTIYLASADGNDSYVVECSSSCEFTTNWTETGTNPMDLTADHNILMPLSGGDILLINRDVSANDIRSKVWNNTTWDASWTMVDAGAVENGTYDVGMSAAVSSTTGDIYLAYIADNNNFTNDNHDIRTATYSSGSWSSNTDIVTNSSRGLTTISLGLDTTSDDIYVAYSGQTEIGTSTTANVYWHKSTDGMSNWGTENGPVNSTSDDIYGVDLNMSSNQRLYVSWFGVTDGAIYGDTIVDIFPGVIASTTGSQTSSVNASTSDFYIGGAFVITSMNQNQSFDVTGITITENGTIDGSTEIENLKLYYESDTSNPYNCESESYGGGESQFGSTDVSGFSGPNGVSTFTGSSVSVSTTSALCVYTVMDIPDSVNSSSTIDISIDDPSSDITVDGGISDPTVSQNIAGETIVYNDTPTLTHFHWRYDDGSETGATSRTAGVEDVALTSMQQSVPTRLRLQVANEGSSSTPAMQYRLEYANNPGVCTDATGWTDVDETADEFDMYDSTHITDGSDTTDILVANGGVSDPPTYSFLSSNGGVKDTSSQTGNIILAMSEYVELEYSIVASTTATEGNSYCFRVTNQGEPLFSYDTYARASINADVTVKVATSTSQIATTSIPATDFYIGSSFALIENSDSRNVTSITIAEDGSIDAENNLTNIELYYDLDTSLPYDCASESYGGGETQFGTTNSSGFSGENGTSTFTGSVAISTTSAMCVYVVLDTTPTAQNGEIINVTIADPSTDVIVSDGGSVGPATTRDLNASTTLQGAVLTQTRYHWKNDNGTEASSTSMTAGVENTVVENISKNTPVRLRLEVSNEGLENSLDTALRLEYGTKISTCENINTWIDVGDVDGAWDMYDSSNIVDGDDTVNILTANNGAVTDDNSSFKTTNAAIKDTSSQIATTTLSTTEFLEAEFSIKQTDDSAFETPYCFRVTNAGNPIGAYTVYPELVTAPDRDFEIQRGSVVISTTTVTITAGVDYTAPASTSTSFIRITNAHHTGAGNSTGGASQNADDVTAYISNPENLLTSIDFTRAGSANNTEIYWEIIEFIGSPGSDNEIIVHDNSTVTYGTSNLTATGTVISGVTDDSDVVVFITGQYNPDTGRNDYNTGQSISSWNATSAEPVFTRAEAGGDAVRVSYSVVEFIGPNWVIQRAEHNYETSTTTETEDINSVNSLSRTFLHTQKMAGTDEQGLDEFGHEVWLSSIGAVSFALQNNASTPSLHTSVAWVIENIQTSNGAAVTTRSDGGYTDVSIPVTLSVEIQTGKTLEDLSNTSIFVNTKVSGGGTSYPRGFAGVTIASSTHYELFLSDANNSITYRTEVYEWPTAGLSFRQNDYQFFVDNDALDPTDAWPVGAVDLGENTVLTGSDEPLGENEHIRIRMSLTVLNATFPEFSKSFKLQYGERVTTCGALDPEDWSDVGSIGSGEIWRAYDAPGITDGTVLSTDPPAVGALNLTLSTVAGTYEENNNSAVNPYIVNEGENLEFDWHVEQNGATPETFYCFRMIFADDSTLGAYDDYPQLRTSSFTARSQNWRWFDDEASETPVTPLADEGVSPTDIANGDTMKLRMTVKEIENIARDDVRFKLQYSEFSDFSIANDVFSTSTCSATTTWCYADGGGVDNAVVSSTTLSDADSCVAGVGDGCGTHNESPDSLSGFRHQNGASSEYEFTISATRLRTNAVYYFRLYDVIQDIPVPINTGETYPSLVTEGASLSFSVAGLPSGTTTAGITIDLTTTATSVDFAPLLVDTEYEAGHRITVNTNAVEGYQVLKFASQQLLNSYGEAINSITTTNSSPGGWSSGCLVSSPGCFGYHTTDPVLQGGSARFSPDDSYAGFSTSTEEIMFSPIPANETHDIIYKIRINELQTSGNYVSDITYIAIPTF